MATTDVFNNPSNDYVYPALSPCAGASDDSNLEFIDGGIGIISGSDILARLNFSDISIPVSSYSIETKILSSGEVVYIPGLTKGLQNRSQRFFMPSLISTDETLNSLFFDIDLSINYYKNFKYTSSAIGVSSDYSQNINIADALNIAFGNIGVGITASYDSSALTFTGNSDGFDFDIMNVNLGIIDASENINSPFPTGVNLDSYLLEEDADSAVLYAKYPNGAMQGIIMKGIYPTDTPMSPYDKWLYINHVSDYVTVYEPIDIQNFLNEIHVSFDPSITFGPFVSSPYTIDSVTLDGVILGPAEVIGDSILFDCTVSDSSIRSSEIYWSDFSGSAIENSAVNIFSIDASERSTISNSIINDSSIWNTMITDTSIYNSILYDVSIIGCTLYNCIEEDLVDKQDTINFYIDSSIDISSTYIDSSTYYNKVIKKLEVGMNGCSTVGIMSAGDYLDWVTTNNFWNKFGDMYIWTSAPDGCSSCRNLIDGFYIFNPQNFTVKIEYMLFV